MPDKDVKIVYTGGLRETYTALQQKQISAAAMGLGNSFGKMLEREGYNSLIDISKLGEDFPFNGIATTRRYLQTNRPTVVNFMKAYLEAIKLNLENRALSKKFLAEYTGVTDNELLDIAYDVYILKIRSKVPYPVNKGWKTLVEFTARDNPKVGSVKAEEILDDSILKELGYVPRLPVNPDNIADAGIVKEWIEDRNLKAFSFYHKKDSYKVVDIVLVHPLDFETAYASKTVKTAAGIDICLAGIDDLIKMKLAAGRGQDLGDIEIHPRP